MFSNWMFIVILYLIFAVIFGQTYKIITNKMKHAGALTVLAEGLAGIASLLLIPLFEIKISSNPYVYIFLGLACIFYAINDRLSTTVRQGVEASTFSLIKQTKTVFMIIGGLLFFKDPFVLKKIIGAFLIIIGNIIVFYKKDTFKSNKYLWLGILASICLAIALMIDANYSEQFNLPLYVSFTTILPALLIFIFDKVKVKDLVDEYKNCNKKLLIIVSFSWAIMILLNLYAYQLGQISVIAPLCSLTVILNVIVGYLFLNEKNRLPQKIFAGILIIISVILITF